MGSFLTFMVWGGWEAARLPWEKETGEIPQDVVRGSSALPHRKASSFPTTPDSKCGKRTRVISKLSLPQSCHIVE
ncbi:hypothetical protein DYE48_13500 [Halobacillus trueperi]|uniref:Uncharacterized protein n=1 Tax=Halobacillus trueperi TaxID=156205 RepID=A0A3E0J6B8_9BACI|nr:hypothetical protein DYE48_13500 [Halobacillus trueperi]